MHGKNISWIMDIPVTMASNIQVSKKEVCPIVVSINTIGKKWSLIIIYELMKEPKSFNELKYSLNGISSKVLAENLLELQENGIIEKNPLSGQPDKNEYCLTCRGEDLKTLMDSLKSWGEKWIAPPV